MHCSLQLDRIYMHLFMRKVRLIKLEFQETCQRNKLRVNNTGITGPAIKRNFLGITWRR